VGVTAFQNAGTYSEIALPASHSTWHPVDLRHHFGNVKQRRIFGPKRDEVTGEWRRLHNKEL
jgi:hypothetical protein